MFTKKHPKGGHIMTTLNEVSKNPDLVEALRLLDIKPNLSSITLMYVWAFKKKPESGSTYVGMLEAVFEYLDNNRWVAMSPQEKFMQWVFKSHEITASGYEKYQQEMNSVLDQYIGNTGVKKHPISWTATVGKPVKVQG